MTRKNSLFFQLSRKKYNFQKHILYEKKGSLTENSYSRSLSPLVIVSDNIKYPYGLSF